MGLAMNRRTVVAAGAVVALATLAVLVLSLRSSHGGTPISNEPVERPGVAAERRSGSSG
jgi:hypothetical protein